jgi:hypothetical protein
VFAAQARFPVSRVRWEGVHSEYVRVSDDGDTRSFAFCPVCGATVFYRLPSDPDLVAVPVGAFADPSFPAPTVSVWEERRHAWVGLPLGIEHID